MHKSAKKSQTSTLDDFVSAREAAKILGVSPEYVGRMCRSGHLKGCKFGGAWHIERTSIVPFVRLRERRRTKRSRQLSEVRLNAYRAHRTQAGPPPPPRRGFITTPFLILGAALLSMSAIAFVSADAIAERLATSSRPAEVSAFSNDSQAAAAAAFLDESDDVEESAAPQPPTTLAYANTTPANEESTSSAVGSPWLALASRGDPSRRSVAEAEAGQLQVSASWLTEQLNDLRADLLSGVQAAVQQPALTFSGPPQTTPASVQLVAHSSKIDRLTGTALSNVTVNGVSGLTDADIPNSITASNYLPLSGGTLTGSLTGTDLTLAGDLTVAGAQSLTGALTVPYVTATSTTEASTFAYRVGIGTSTPAVNLHVDGGDSATNAHIQASGARHVRLNLKNTSGNFETFLLNHGQQARWVLNNSIKMTLNNEGNLTFSSSPTSGQSKLTVSGNAAVGSGYTSTAAPTNGLIVQGNVGIGLTGPGSRLSVKGSTADNSASALNVLDSADESLLFVRNDGNVGIGTISPDAQLQVHASSASKVAQIIRAAASQTANLTEWQDSAGTTLASISADGKRLRLNDNTQAVYIPGGDFTGTLVVGNGGTNLSHVSGNQGRFNTFVGSLAGLANTTGFNNAFLGHNTGSSNTTGNNNSFFGFQAGRNNASGSSNSFFGRDAGRNNASGSSNSALGMNALFNNTTGINNSAFGLDAGRWMADGSTPNETGSNSLFLGRDTKALADGQSNQIVIGFNATGLGSNTVVLGNSSIVTTALRGNVGIGTTTPSSKLTVSGTANITGAVNLGSSLTVTGNISSPGMGSASERFGVSASADGAEALAVGRSASANFVRTTALGKDASATSGSATAVGQAASAGSSATAVGRAAVAASSATAVGSNSSTGNFATALGTNAAASGNSASAMGEGASAGHTAAIALGRSAATTKANQLAIGSAGFPISEVLFSDTVNFTTSSGDLILNPSGNTGIGTTTPVSKLTVVGSANVTGSVALGSSLTVTGTISSPGTGNNSEKFGSGASAAGTNSTALGQGALTANSNATAVGHNTSAGIRSVALGASASSVSNAIAIGYLSSAAHTSAIALGREAATTKANQLAIGSASFPISEVLFADTVDFATASGDLTFNPSGNVGIGTTTPYAKLGVQNTLADQTAMAIVGHDSQSAPLFDIWNSPTSNTSLFRITSTGNVGIGTTDPGAVTPVGWANNSNSRMLDIQAQVGSSDAGITLGRIDNSTIRGTLWHDGTGGDIYLDNSFNHNDGDIFFRTKISGTPINALTIKGSGNVGIGTTSPATTLSVSGNGYLTGGFGVGRLNTVAGTLETSGNASFYGDATIQDGKKLRLRRNLVDSFGWAMYANPSNTFTLTTGVNGDGTTLLTFTDSGALAVFGSLTTTGNVGIGTTGRDFTRLDLRLDQDATTGVDHHLVYGDLLHAAMGSTVTNIFGVKLNYSNPSTANKLIHGFSINHDSAGAGNHLKTAFHATTTSAGGAINPTLVDVSGTYTTDLTASRTAHGVKALLNFTSTSNNTNVNQRVFGGEFRVNVASIWNENQSTLSHFHALRAIADIHAGNTADKVSVRALSIENPTAHADHFGLYQESTTVKNYFGGNVGIGTTSPWRKLSVAGTVGFDGLTGATGAGSLCLDSSNQVVYNAGSDACLSSTRDTKHDVEGLSLEGLEIVDRLEPVSFVYNQGDGRTRYGFVAEDAAEIAPSLATYNSSSSITGIDDRAILSVAVKAIKELWAYVKERFDSHDNRIATLEAEVAALKSQLGTSGAASAGGSSGEGTTSTDVAPPASTTSSTESHANGPDDQQTATSSPTAATSTPSTFPPAPDVEPSSPEDQVTAANDNEPTASADDQAEAGDNLFASGTPAANDNMPVLGAASPTGGMSSTTAAH